MSIDIELQKHETTHTHVPTPMIDIYKDFASDVGDNLCNVENDVKRRFLYSGVFHYVNTHMYFILKGYNDNYQIMKLF